MIDQGSQVIDKYNAMPSWSDQAQQFATRDPHDLLIDPAYTQFVMGMAGPGKVKGATAARMPQLAERYPEIAPIPIYGLAGLTAGGIGGSVLGSQDRGRQ